ncbi:MAG: DinB family protein [Vicinamibacterales bacterium]
MGLRERLLADYDHEIASTRRVLTSLPAERFGWTPHARARTVAELAAHLTDVVGWARPILTQEWFDLNDTPSPPPRPESRTELLERFDATSARTRQDMDRSDAEYTALWCLKRGSAEVFALPRESAFRAFVLHHVIHHRGQLTIYLRLAGVAVPAVYGPTGDDS